MLSELKIKEKDKVVFHSNANQNTTITRDSGTVFKFYCFGARYLDPRTSRWISADPAVSDYIPQTPTDDDARKHNQNLPGMGGVYNLVNLHVYHYAGNNPVKYVDPDGNDIVLLNRSYGAFKNGHNAVMVGNDKNGWYLYSKDDLNLNTRKFYNTFNDFVKENQNSKKKEQYDRAVRVTTSETDDRKMQEKGDKVYDRKYSIWERSNENGETTKQNCADLVADIVSESDTGAIDKPKMRTGITWPNKQIENFAANNSTEINNLPVTPKPDN